MKQYEVTVSFVIEAENSTEAKFTAKEVAEECRNYSCIDQASSTVKEIKED
jgi:hypothetical protein